MPGLKELEHFKQELSRLGDERAVAASRGEVFEEYPEPEETPATGPSLNIDDLLSSIGETAPLSGSYELPPAGNAVSDDFGFPVSMDTPEIEEPSSALDSPDSPDPSPGDLSGLDDLLASLDLDMPESTPSMDFDESSSVPDGFDDSVASTLSTAGSATGDDDFSMPDGLLSGFADDIEKGRAEEDTGLAEFDVPEELSADDLAVPDALDSVEALDSLDDLAPIESTPSGDDADMEAMDFTPGFEDGGPEPVPPSDDLFSAFTGSGDFAKAEGGGANVDAFSDFSIPDDLVTPSGDAEDAPAVIDGFEGFSLDEDFLKSTIETAGDDDEFNIPGFSDFTSGPSRPAVSDLGNVQGRTSGKKHVPMEISDEEFHRFLGILAGYPLNLRLAVEEYLSPDDGNEIHKMELVHSILGGAPIRKIARNLENLLSRTIPIPRDFEKKNVSDYELEKTSLRYVFFNKILPIAIIFTIAATLAACVFYLSYQFIYRPLAAESLYRRGYAAIEDARYSESVNYFEKAVKVWEKKGWYFKYARAYRDRRQYERAALMYERILARYDHNLDAGLEYAQMLRDLRNFVKAEEILKREVLDHHVNDRAGLLLLGDLYLDWAEEDPAKFEEARRMFALLIELYGSQDEFLARMMRYFMRTDNLAEVLPLKEHFMGRKTKIGAADIIELGGYLLKKRYEAESGEESILRDKIEDLRAILERGVRADGASPEAHYNIGRFFIYNKMEDKAMTALREAVRLYDDARFMSPRRILDAVDARRRLGELFVGNMEFLKAYETYATAIDYFQKENDNYRLPEDRRVGRLYADIADIDYFISNDLDAALGNYSKATEHGNATPSIRYRIGYVHYVHQAYESAMEAFHLARLENPSDPNLLYGFANTLFRKDDFAASQAYYDTLMESLDAERLRKGVVLPQVREDHGEFVELYMRTANNLGATLNRQASRTGDSRKNARAMALFSESARAWDALTRNPETMVRLEGSNLANLNIRNMTHPMPAYKSEIYADIPKTLDGEEVLRQTEDVAGRD